MTSAVMFLCSPKAALVFLYLNFKSDGHLQNKISILFNGTRNPRLVLRALVFVNVGWQVGHISKVIFQIIHGVVSLLLQGSVYVMSKVPSAYRSYPRLSLPFEPVFLSWIQSCRREHEARVLAPSRITLPYLQDSKGFSMSQT